MSNRAARALKMVGLIVACSPVVIMLVATVDLRYVTQAQSAVQNARQDSAIVRLQNSQLRDSLNYSARFDRLDRIGCVRLNKHEKEIAGCPK